MDDAWTLPCYGGPWDGRIVSSIGEWILLPPYRECYSGISGTVNLHLYRHVEGIDWHCWSHARVIGFDLEKKTEG